MDNSHVQKKETGESYIDWLWNKEHDEERRIAIEEVACSIRHGKKMNKYELYDKYKKQYNFRDGDCCATCKYGDVYHEEEMHCNRLEHIEVAHFEICDLFEKEKQ